MKNRNPDLNKAIERAEKGAFREYWLQLYIKDNYKKLGFDSLEGPFEWGYDFKGFYQGKRVVVEAERTPKKFISHGHNPKEVQILIVLADDNADRSSLPKKIIKVDPEDFVKATYEMRKDYAIKMQKAGKDYASLQKDYEIKMQNQRKMYPFNRLKSAFVTLFGLYIEEIPYEGTPEEEIFVKAIESTAISYLVAYDIEPEELRTKPAKIEILANSLVKSKSEFDNLTNEEQSFLENWIGILREEYADRI